MVPFVSLAVLAVLPFSLFVAFKFRSVYLKTSDVNIGYLYKSFLFFSIGLVFLSLPGLVVNDLKIIDLAYDIYPFFFTLAIAFFVNITFEIMHRAAIKKIIFWLLVAGGLFISVIPALNWGEAKTVYDGTAVFWEDTRGVLVNIVLGLIMTVPSFWFLLFFIWNGILGKEKAVKNRAFLMATGMAFWLLLGLNDYIFGAFLNNAYVSVVTSVFGDAFVAFFLLAIKQQPQSFNA